MGIFEINPAINYGALDENISRKGQVSKQLSYASESSGDKVSFSAEALEKSKTALFEGNNRVEPSPANPQTKTAAPRVNLFAMLMESLFLAELEESQEGLAVPESQATGQEGNFSGGQKSVLSDSNKLAELKKVINDFMTGKADMADLPKAMASSVNKSVYSGVAVNKNEPGEAKSWPS